MRVFVLGTGRCGTVTFSKACEHIDNYTTGHESKHGEPPPARTDFPEDHIEIDNRLSWLLGELGKQYADATYVHLRRDPEAVAQSYRRRLNVDPPHRYLRLPRALYPIGRRMETRRPYHSIIEAYAYPLLGRSKPWSDDEKLTICRSYVWTVTSNVDEFLKGKRSLDIEIENAAHELPRFWELIDAHGSLDAAKAEFEQHYNAS